MACLNMELWGRWVGGFSLLCIEENTKYIMYEALFSCNTLRHCTVGGRLHVVMRSTRRCGCRDERRSAEMSRPAATYLHGRGHDGNV